MLGSIYYFAPNKLFIVYKILINAKTLNWYYIKQFYTTAKENISEYFTSYQWMKVCIRMVKVWINFYIEIEIYCRVVEIS